MLVTATADDLLDTLEQLPPASPDPTLTDPYDDFIDALRTRAEGSAHNQELIATNLDTYKHEVTANIDEAGQPFDVKVRLGNGQLRDQADAACFELQAALTAADLPLLTCTPG